MANASKPSGENWSRAAKDYAKVIDETDELNPVGAGCKQILDVVATTLPFDEASYILDMGTGPGPLISSVLNSSEHAAKIPSDARIVAADVAQGLLDMLVQRKAEREDAEPLWRRLEIVNWDARDLTANIQDGEVSHLLATYAYFAFSGEQAALSEAYRILKPGGLFVETSMGYTEWGHLPQLFKAVRPEVTIPGPGENWQSVGGVKATLEGAGFKDVQVTEYEIGLRFETYEAALSLIFEAFPWVKGFVADWGEAEVQQAREKMVEFMRSKHPEEPLVLRGTGLVGWARK